MSPTRPRPAVDQPGSGSVPLEAVMCTEELARRPARPPDHETENRALASLAQAMADSPRTFLQALADTILEVLQTDSAGLSLLTTSDGGKRFYWPAIAGAWRPHVGGGTPREFGPCGDVLDRDAAQLFQHFERRYSYLLPATPPAVEALIVPFHVQGVAVGTIWAMAHDDRRRFDAEDRRQLENLGRFAAVAYHVLGLQTSEDSRRAALNLMEDAVQARQATEALVETIRQREATFRQMIDALPAAVYTTDAAGRLTHFNPAAVQLAGRTPVVGEDEWRVTARLFRPDGTLLPRDDYPMSMAIKAGRAILGMEVIAERPDGTRVWGAVHPTPLHDNAGHIVGGINMVVDITERKRVEQALLDHQQRLEFVLESARAGEWELDVVTGEARCSFRHDQCFGATEPIPDWSYAKFLSRVHPDDRASEDGKFRAAVAEGGDWNISCRVVWPDGSVHWIESIGRCYRNQEGNATIMSGMVREVTDRKLLEQELRGSEVRYRRLFESAHDGILILDAETGTIADSNPFISDLLGFSRAELAGKELWEIGLFRDIEASKNAMRELQKEGFIRYQDLPLEAKAGRRIEVEFVSNVYVEGARSVIQCNVRDITERRILEADLELRNEELARADESKNQFIAMLSHELRSPLNAIRGWIQILRRPDARAEDVHKGLEVIDRNSKAQAELISDLLDVHGIAAGKIRLELATIDLQEAIDLAVTGLTPVAAAKEIDIVWARGAAPTLVSGDALRLHQVLSNLIGNSIKFTPKGGHVRVTLRQQAGRAELVVSDTGQGISVAALPHIFERFRQADPDTTRYEGGLGLGLSIARRLVELHGGTITASSPGKGRGATFSVSLPLLVAGAVLPPVRDDGAGDETPVSLGGLLVLLVDDEADAREPVRRVLEGAGAETIAVASADQALAVFEDRRPDVIVSDIAMPGRDGYDLMRSICALPPTRGRRVPGIALTAFAAAEDRERAKRAGFQVHLTKPVGRAELIAAVAALANEVHGEMPPRTA